MNENRDTIQTATITMPDGRQVGYADFGPANGSPVLWCHGGPGSRLEPSIDAPAARTAGYRFISIDRPGYGLSTPQPGRTIGGWVADDVAVLDALGIERYLVAGISTGGAYALALAAAAPERITGVIACCSVTDMRWEPGRVKQAVMLGGIWDAPDRDAAIAAAEVLLGKDGSNLLTRSDDGPKMPSADLALMSDPVWGAAMMEGFPQMFAHGVQGYADDRIADGVGWVSFDVGAVKAPTIVLHGSEDSIVDVAQAHHTADIVPRARLKIVDGLGHLSINSQIVPTLAEL